MSKGINKFIGIGNCCNDPETRYSQAGAAITNITIACNESWKDKNTGQMQERAEFIRVVLFNRLGEIAGEYLKKGSKVYVEGQLRTRKWQDKDGSDRYTTEIVAKEMQMLDSKQQGDDPGRHASGNRNQPNPTYTPAQQAPAGDDWDDDIPF